MMHSSGGTVSPIHRTRARRKGRRREYEYPGLYVKVWNGESIRAKEHIRHNASCNKLLIELNKNSFFDGVKI